MEYHEMRDIVAEARKKHEEQNRTQSKKRLMTNIQRKFNTTMIGGLAVLEKHLGYLWGHGEPYDRLTPEQKKMREKWEEIRTEILNNGNNQLRAALDEIAQYSLSWDKYKVNFIVKQTGDRHE